MTFTLYPAIDVRDGRVVRLKQGDYAQETRYPADPFELAQRYSAAGAEWLHLVDLDAARAGGYTLAPLLRRIATETTLRVQSGGGVRSEVDVLRLLDAGATRVVVGSLAVREPERVARWIADYGGERVTLALDTRQHEAGHWCLPVRGWTEVSNRGLDEILAFHVEAGLRHLLCTDIARDGMLSGPNLELYAHLRRAAPGVAIQASGGARHLADVRAVADAGCAGLVLGRALLEGHLDLGEALAC